ncbi:MAG TPA: hypothetical protein VF516_47115, partial [Kofleriaceae bacterium]
MAREAHGARDGPRLRSSSELSKIDVGIALPHRRRRGGCRQRAKVDHGSSCQLVGERSNAAIASDHEQDQRLEVCQEAARKRLATAAPATAIRPSRASRIAGQARRLG